MLYFCLFLLICKQYLDSYVSFWVAVCVCLCARAHFNGIRATLVRETQLLWRIKMNVIMLYRSCNSTIIYFCRRKFTVYKLQLPFTTIKKNNIDQHPCLRILFPRNYLQNFYVRVKSSDACHLEKNSLFVSWCILLSKDLRQPEWRSSFEIPWICASEGRKVVFHNTSCWKELMITLITSSFFKNLILL